MANDEEVVLSDKEIKELEKQKLNLPSSQDDFEVTNTGDAVGIEYSTGGRFTLPEFGYFKDYTTKEFNDLALTRQEDKLEVLISILNKKSVNEEIDIIKLNHYTNFQPLYWRDNIIKRDKII